MLIRFLCIMTQKYEIFSLYYIFNILIFSFILHWPSSEQGCITNE